MTAVIAICKCSSNNKTYGIRFEKDGRDWKYTWAFPINEKSALREDYDKTNITGNLVEGEEYPGCPYCGTKGFFYCGCGKLNCWDTKTRIATCNWCGSRGELTDGIDSINISGNI